MRSDDGKNVILHGQSRNKDYASVILNLADIFTIVWECSQYEYLDELFTIEKVDGKFRPLKKRPFLKIIQDHIKEIERLA